jgi:glycosidase
MKGITSRHLKPLAIAFSAALAACAAPGEKQPANIAQAPPELYGTLEPMAANAVYFVLTDRFVNGDTANDQRGQGGRFKTFDRPTPGGPREEADNVGYLGGDFRGLLNNAKYIKDLGFGAVWITPIVDNPDEAFSGGKPAVWKGAFTDGGKTGYHGYWGDNFYQLDEHLPSADLDFKVLTAGLKLQGLKTVLDIVCNHGSPAFSMTKAQPKFGQIFDASNTLIADHQNLTPDKLDPANNPLHRFYTTKKTELAELSDNDEDNPAVLEYFVGAYLQWIDQGADAFRVDTVRHMKNSFWHDFNARIRAKHPGFFMFGESYDYLAAKIAVHTLPENGAMSVLDFPLKAAIETAFSKPEGGFGVIADALYLENGPYANPYELMSFYDNHDMARFAGTDTDFINANNFLFTARGIPIIYYGSETGFMRGTVEHAGNRNYFGQANIDAAPKNPIYQALQRIAKLRQSSVALQRGLQLNLTMEHDHAAFLRVYQHDGVSQTALVLLNKAATPGAFTLDARVPSGTWTQALGGVETQLSAGQSLSVPANGVAVYLQNSAVDAALAESLRGRMVR